MKILERSINILCGSLDIDNEQRFYFLTKFLEVEVHDKAALKQELINAIADEKFDFLKLISENDELIENPNLYSKRELINYIKGWLWDYLYPEKQLSQIQIQELGKEVLNILKQFSSYEGWMYSYDLYEELRKQEQFKDLEYYNLWKIPFDKSNIERKPINEKDREIGYLRYKAPPAGARL